MDAAARDLERRLEARIRSGGSRLGNPGLIDRVLDSIGAAGVREALDLGSGCGELLARLGRSGIRGTGLDLCRSLLERSRPKLPSGASLVQGDVEALPIPDGRFDLATSVLVLHYVRRPRRALEEALRILRPGGRLILADRIASPHPVMRELHHLLEQMRNPSFRRILTGDEIEAALREAGFEVQGSGAYDDRLPLEAWLSGMEAKDVDRIRGVLKELSGQDLGGLVVERGGMLRLRIRIFDARKPS